MEIILSKDILGTLPEPDKNGLVRVNVAMNVTPDGKATIAEINDVPMGMEPEVEEAMEEEMPTPASPDEISASIYAE